MDASRKKPSRLPELPTELVEQVLVETIESAYCARSARSGRTEELEHITLKIASLSRHCLRLIMDAIKDRAIIVDRSRHNSTRWWRVLFDESANLPRAAVIPRGIASPPPPSPPHVLNQDRLYEALVECYKDTSNGRGRQIRFDDMSTPRSGDWVLGKVLHYLQVAAWCFDIDNE